LWRFYVEHEHIYINKKSPYIVFYTILGSYIFKFYNLFLYRPFSILQHHTLLTISYTIRSFTNLNFAITLLVVLSIALTILSYMLVTYTNLLSALVTTPWDPLPVFIVAIKVFSSLVTAVVTGFLPTIIFLIFYCFLCL